MTDYNKIITTVNSVTSDFEFIPNNNNVIVIDTSNNRIGINTINPQYSIDVCNGRIRTNTLEIMEAGGLILAGNSTATLQNPDTLNVNNSATFQQNCIVTINNTANNALLSEFNKLHHSISRIESYINHEQHLKDEIDKRDRKIRILEKKLKEKNNKYEYYA